MEQPPTSLDSPCALQAIGGIWGGGGGVGRRGIQTHVLRGNRDTSCVSGMSQQKPPDGTNMYKPMKGLHVGVRLILYHVILFSHFIIFHITL